MAYLDKTTGLIQIGQRNSGSTVDLSFITAAAGDIRSGKVGANTSGNPVAGTLDVTSGGGVISAAKITEFIPYSAAHTATTGITVSGITVKGSEDDGDLTDYTSANGNYVVTEETASELDPFARVYKHESAEWYIYGSYYSEAEEGYWYIAKSTTSEEMAWVTNGSREDGILTDGTVTFEDYVDWYWSWEVTIATTETSYPEQPLVLKGNLAECFSTGNMEWTFSTSVSEFLGYDFAPAVGQLFLVNNQRLVSKSLGYDPADMQAITLAYADPGVDKSPLQGLGVQYLAQTTIDGVPCVYFDWELPGTFIDDKMESAVYMPLSKTIVANNGFTLMGTMYCAEFSSYGRIMSLTQKIVPSDGVTQVSGGVTPDKEDGSRIGLWFCGTHGFQIQYNTDSDGYMGDLSYAKDYKTSKDTYHGKWVQFALMLKDYFMYVWLNGEVKIIGPWGYGHLNLTFNYLSFKDATGAGIHFGPMFAFDRALSPNEVFYQLNKLTRQING